MEADLLKILNTISEKIIHSTNYIYIHGEDERLAAAVIEVLRRNLIPLEKVEAWAKSFVEQDWKGAYTVEDKNRALQNTRNLLRSVFLELQKEDKDLFGREELQKIFFNALSI